MSSFLERENQQQRSRTERAKRILDVSYYCVLVLATLSGRYEAEESFPNAAACLAIDPNDKAMMIGLMFWKLSSVFRVFLNRVLYGLSILPLRAIAAIVAISHSFSPVEEC